MQIMLLALLLLQLIICFSVFVICFIDNKLLSNIVKHFGINEKPIKNNTPEFDKESSVSLIEISDDKQNETTRYSTYGYEELDTFSDPRGSQTDPEKLLQILEYGIPDEELEEIVKSIESVN